MGRFRILVAVIVMVFGCMYAQSVYAQTNLALNKTYTLQSGGDFQGDNGLKMTDGTSVVWNANNETGSYVSWQYVAPVITVDLASVQSVGSASLVYVDISALTPRNAWPQSVSVSYSLDGSTFYDLGQTSSVSSSNAFSHTYLVSFSSVNARYLKFTVASNTSDGSVVSFSEAFVYGVSAPVASQLAYAQQPSNVDLGSVITPAVTVQLKDSQGSNVSESDVVVDLALTSGSGVLSGTLQQNTDASGLATFANISIDSAGAKKLTASSTGLTSVESNEFTVASQPTSTPPAPTPTLTPTPSVNSTPSMSGAIYGRVVNKSLSPFPGVRVEYSSSENDYEGKNPVVTDADGYYFFVNCDTSYLSSLEMSLKGYGSVTVAVAGMSTGIVNRLSDVVMNKGNSGKYKLTGTVKDAHGTPVDFVRVTAKSGGVAYVDFTDLSGGYSLSDMLTGSYTVTIKRDGYYNGRYKYSNVDASDGVLDMVILDKSYDFSVKKN